MQKHEKLLVAGFPLPLYLILAALTLLCTALGCLPDNMVGALLFLMVVGEGFNALGNTIPLIKTYLGGSVLCIFGGALIAASGILPEQTVALLDSFINRQGFLIFYIAALITGSLFGIDRRLLLRGAVRLLPVGILAVLAGVITCGIMGVIGGNGFWDNILYVAVPMTAGGMTAGTVPLSEVYATALGVSSGEILTRMAPATVLGNCTAIVFAGLLNHLGEKRPELSGGGRLVNDGKPAPKQELGAPSPTKLFMGMLVALGFYTLGSLWHRFMPILPIYACMILLVISVKCLRLLPAEVEESACHWNSFVIKAWTAAALFGIGVTLIDLPTIWHSMTLYYFLTVLVMEIVITAVAAFAGKAVGFYPLESAVCGMCSTNMGGSGNVAVLSGAHRMQLLPFAQIITRGCGAIMLTVGGILVQMVG